MVIGQLVGRVRALDLELDARAVSFRRILERRRHRRGLSGQLLVVAAARLALDEHLVGHDVGRHAALDHADVGRGLRIDAAQRHRGDRLAGDADGVDALLRLRARVRGLAVHLDLQGVLAGRAGDDDADGPARVQHVAAPRRAACSCPAFARRASPTSSLTEMTTSSGGCAVRPRKRPDHLQDGGHARLVVAAQDGRAVGVDHAVADHRLDPTSLPTVSMCALSIRQSPGPAREARDQVVVLVVLHLAAQLGEAARQVLADGCFLARWAVDGDQVEESLDKSFFVDQRSPLSIRS